MNATLKTSAKQQAAVRQTVTVVIPTLNVEAILGRCLDALTWADAVHVVDMFSADQTLDVCARYPNVRVFQRKDYIFANVNYGMEQATTDWVIRLDSDEVLNPELQASIRRVLANPDPDVSGYIFPSVQYIFGKPMHWGVGLPRLNQRKCMFRKGTAHYECKAEHEDIVTTGAMKVLEGCYEHFTNATVSEFIRKMNYYGDKDTERLSGSELQPKPVWRVLYLSVRMFILYYVQWKGYKDGWVGFYSSLMRGPVYIFVGEAKRWEAWMRCQDREDRRGQG